MPGRQRVATVVAETGAFHRVHGLIAVDAVEDRTTDDVLGALVAPERLVAVLRRRRADLGDRYDRAGPAGNYFTADQALAPIADLLVGLNASYSTSRPEDRRYARMFTQLDAALLLDYVKIFALSPQPPNAARIDAWASALVLGLSATGKF